MNRTAGTAARRLALAVDEFLPAGAVWIWRQMMGDGLRPVVVLCQRRIEETVFPFDACVVAPPRSELLARLRGKAWCLVRERPPRLRRRAARCYRSALKRESVTLVHAHFGTVGLPLLPLCRELDVPLIVTFHGFDASSVPRRWPGYRRTLVGFFRECQSIVAVSKHTGRQLTRLGCPVEKVRISYLGVPLDQIPWTNRQSRTSGPVRFLHAGRLTAKKGVPDLVRAFAAAFMRPGEAILDIAGDGEERSLVEETIAAVRPVGEVRLLGQLSQDELQHVRERADVFVANSRTDGQGTEEGLPISILEAAANGLPVVSTFHAGIPEAVIDGGTGRLVAERDTDALSAALREAADPVIRFRWSAAARPFTEQTFSLGRCNEKLREIYEEVAG